MIKNSHSNATLITPIITQPTNELTKFHLITPKILHNCPNCGQTDHQQSNSINGPMNKKIKITSRTKQNENNSINTVCFLFKLFIFDCKFNV